MANIGTLTATIGADTSQLRQGLTSSRRQLRRFSQEGRASFSGMRSSLSGLVGPIIGVTAAFAGWRIIKDIVAESISAFNEYEANLNSIRAVTETTGRDAVAVFNAMEARVGSLASRASLASGFLKGLTTELNVEQIGQLTDAIRDASIAMGEDFNVQLPLIIKAIKQLNPAILDNIGVTIRLDRVNKLIREGYYGNIKAINEYTQQQAIFQEIISQTAKFRGLEAKFLETNAGKVKALKVAWEDLNLVLGELLAPIQAGLLPVLQDLTFAVQEFTKHSGIAFAIFAVSFAATVEEINKFIDNSLRFWRSSFKALEALAQLDFRAFTLQSGIAAESLRQNMLSVENVLHNIETGTRAVRTSIRRLFDDIITGAPEANKQLSSLTNLQLKPQESHQEMWDAINRGREMAYEAHLDRLSALEDLRFEASLVGLNKFHQVYLRMQRRILDQLKKIYDDDRLTFEQKERAKLDAYWILWGEMQEAQQMYRESLDLTKRNIEGFSNDVTGFIRRIADESRHMIEDVFVRTLEGQFAKLRDFFRALYTEITNVLARISAQLLVSDIYKLFGLNQPQPQFNPFGFLPAIPGLQHGGIVTQPQLAMVGEVPEAVIPLSKLNDPKFWDEIGGDKSTQNITVNMNVQTPDVAGFKASESQLISRLAVAMSSARRNL